MKTRTTAEERQTLREQAGGAVTQRALADLEDALAENASMRAALDSIGSGFGLAGQPPEVVAKGYQEQREHFSETWLEDPNKHTPDICPTYFDGCHCTVDTLTHNIERAQKAEAENAHQAAVIERVRGIATRMTGEADPAMRDEADEILAALDETEAERG